MSIKKHIPNAITCSNLLCGCLAIVCAFNGNLTWSAYLVGLAAVLDFFDGFVARLLKVGGEMGKQLDSLADMVTFGVVPGVVMYHLIKQGIDYKNYFSQGVVDTTFFGTIAPFLPYTAFLITIFSCIRLAKFNIDTRQTDSFIGVPTPANTILICSLPLIIEFHRDGYGKYHTLLLNPYLLIGLTIVMSYLLIAELPLFALKFKNFGWPDNKIRYSFLIISVILLILFQFIAIPFIIFLYIVLSVINNMTNKTKLSEH
ncbi:MAG TPA: CDP-alcohol phosphatidyltransferase family protein [Bacteroidia bacterium]|jgi:CDP-diacylglycerol--serine O-phosphatidyltransferase